MWSSDLFFCDQLRHEAITIYMGTAREIGLLTTFDYKPMSSNLRAHVLNPLLVRHYLMAYFNYKTGNNFGYLYAPPVSAKRAQPASISAVFV